jgi:hypothetical protein
MASQGAKTNVQTNPCDQREQANAGSLYLAVLVGRVVCTFSSILTFSFTTRSSNPRYDTRLVHAGESNARSRLRSSFAATDNIACVPLSKICIGSSPLSRSYMVDALQIIGLHGRGTVRPTPTLRLALCFPGPELTCATQAAHLPH